VPTVAEALGTEFDVETWYAIGAPARMPAFVTDRITEVARAMHGNAELRARLADLGLSPREPGTPAATRAAVHAEIARWAEVIERTRMERQ
jgi:tripartite-type tricarboxylate transporter receptor subunit TctC